MEQYPKLNFCFKISAVSDHLLLSPRTERKLWYSWLDLLTSVHG